MLSLAHHYLKQELMQKGEVIVRRLAESHSVEVSLGLADELEPILRRIIETEPGIEYVEFVDASGRIITTSDGRHKAQSNSGRRPSSFAQFRIENLSNSKIPQGHSVTGVDGKELYGFYAPVVSISANPNESSSMDLSLVGESPPKEKKVIGAVRMAVQPKTLTEAIGNLRIVFLVTIVAATLFGLAIAFVLSRSVTTSVAHVAEAASVLAQGDLNRQVPPSGKDELGMSDTIARLEPFLKA